MTIKVVACDLDGTFLNEQGSYDRTRFERVLACLEQKDIRFVVASGNNMKRIKLIFDGLVDRLSYVAENGAYVLENNQPLIRQHMNQSDIQDFLAYFQGRHRDYRVMISTGSGSYMLEGINMANAFHMIEEEQMKLFLSGIRFIEDFSQLPQGEEILKVTMLLPVDQCNQICQEFNQAFEGRLTAVTSGFGAIDIITTGIHKAWGLQILLEKWGVTSEQVMAFGDGENDIEMLKLAKLSYAMDNAPQTVKSVARYLAPHHRDEGVLRVLEDKFLS
ncbi:Cof-type HAD-IIB family hydrolase [Streptococcus caprae]|uniref:Cof-type HAD-IIB family hydrolase n=1 Tax=Streptococcus caprae TaxID=1640501 RepID=A0ABV8CTM7_9STRE